MRGKKAPLSKICYIDSTMMELGMVIPYLKKIQKIYKSQDTPLEFCWHQHFFIGNQQLLLYHEIQIQNAFKYIISNLLTFFESLKVVLRIMVVILMSAKLATLGLLKIKVFWSKVYDVIFSVHDVTNKLFSRGSN